MVNTEKIRIADIEFPIRAKNILLKNNITTLAELLKYTESEIRGLKGAGYRVFGDIKTVLAKYGYALKTSVLEEATFPDKPPIAELPKESIQMSRIKGFIKIKDYDCTNEREVTEIANAMAIASVEHYCVKQEDTPEDYRIQSLITFIGGNILYSYETVEEIATKMAVALNG